MDIGFFLAQSAADDDDDDIGADFSVDFALACTTSVPSGDATLFLVAMDWTLCHQVLLL